MGNKDHGYSVSAGLPAGTYCNGAWQHGITIETPDRCFLFTCESESDQQDWLKHFSDVMSAQMSPQEYTSKIQRLFLHPGDQSNIRVRMLLADLRSAAVGVKL